MRFKPLIFLMFAAAPGVQAAEIIVRDSRTGRGIEAELALAALEAPAPPTAKALSDLLVGTPELEREFLRVRARGALDVRIPTLAKVSAPGYAPLWTVLRPAPENRGWTLWLDSVEVAPAVSPDAETHWLEGHVNDAHLLAPVSGARVTLAATGLTTHTDDSGYYRLPLPPEAASPRTPTTLELQVEASGFRVWRGELVAGPGITRFLVDLGGAPGTSAAHRHLSAPDAWRIPELHETPRPAPLGEPGDIPPASITVGFGDAGCTQSCCTGNCPHACTFSLEEYVRRGLPREWIASWQQDSLRAGAVAYRAYGAWHALNPPAHGAYDICSSACCQVNGPGSNSNTNQAVEATPGLLLTRGGGVFRAEYSAENNCLFGEVSCANGDLSCGNGFAGSPAAGWPCLDDPVGLDRDCFGHGRGMSQWGTQRWSLAPHSRSWKWQLNHYYNDHGAGGGLRTAGISRVLVIDALRVLPAEAAPGTAITLELDVRNLAAEIHESVLVGASLRRPPGPFVNDPDNDQPVSLPSGAGTVSRTFELPADLPAGEYDVYASLYVDVDGDGGISTDDLVQHLVIVSGGLWVESDEAIFEDRFQTP